MVNVVGLVVAFLRSELSVSYVHAEIPQGAGRPVILVEENGGGPQGSSLSPDRITIADVQLRYWADTKAAAWDLASSATSALRGAPRSSPVQSLGVLIRVEPLFPVYLPDEDWPVNSRPGPRYEQTVRIRARTA